MWGWTVILNRQYPSVVEVPSVQPAQLPNIPGNGGITVTNNDGTYSADLSIHQSFPPSQTQTLGPHQSIIFSDGSPVWARVTPGQAGNPTGIELGIWPGSPSAPQGAVNIINTPTYATVASVPAGSDFAYTIPTGAPLRLVSFRATFTASSQSGRRYPYLWQVVAGDTLPTAETLLTPDSIGVSEVIVVDAVPGGLPGTRSGPRRPATGSFGTSVTTLYTAPPGGWFSQGQLFLYNPGASSVTAFVQVAGVNVAAVSIGPTLGATVAIPELQAGDVLTANTSTGTVDYTLSGQENADNRRVVDFSGLLLPPGSTVQTATGGLQSGDQWTDINLAFVQS